MQHSCLEGSQVQHKELILHPRKQQTAHQGPVHILYDRMLQSPELQAGKRQRFMCLVLNPDGRTGLQRERRNGCRGFIVEHVLLYYQLYLPLQGYLGTFGKDTVTLPGVLNAKPLTWTGLFACFDNTFFCAENATTCIAQNTGCPPPSPAQVNGSCPSGTGLEAGVKGERQV